MKHLTLCFLLVLTLNACQQSDKPSIIGTWELISATSTEKDSTYSTFNPKVKMLKIINPTHFAFLSHDLQGGKDSTSATFTAGAGTYTLKDSLYTEHLDYFIDRQWENNSFEFVVKINNDTLVQKGVEKLEKLGINRIIIETYKRVK
ncbi:MAG: hypothetical protein U0Y10_17100 [Spirosomataceae bacterium]